MSQPERFVAERPLSAGPRSVTVDSAADLVLKAP
jgi:hypothetical protein